MIWHGSYKKSWPKNICFSYGCHNYSYKLTLSIKCYVIWNKADNNFLYEWDGVPGKKINKQDNIIFLWTFLCFFRCLLTFQIPWFRQKYKARHQLLDEWTKNMKRKRYSFKIKRTRTIQLDFKTILFLVRKIIAELSSTETIIMWKFGYKGYLKKKSRGICDDAQR